MVLHQSCSLLILHNKCVLKKIVKSEYSRLTTLIFLFFGIQLTNVQAEALNKKDIDRYLGSTPDYVERSTGLLYNALEFGDIKLFKRAIRAGADVNYHAEKNIPTPLCVAAENKLTQHMQALLHSGAEAALVHGGRYPAKQAAINCAVNVGYMTRLKCSSNGVLT